MAETLEQAAQRLRIIADDLCRRFDGNRVVLPIALPNSIEAMRMILVRLELEAETAEQTSEEQGG